MGVSTCFNAARVQVGHSKAWLGSWGQALVLAALQASPECSLLLRGQCCAHHESSSCLEGTLGYRGHKLSMFNPRSVHVCMDKGECLCVCMFVKGLGEGGGVFS
jgi:hypothetical protein